MEEITKWEKLEIIENELKAELDKNLVEKDQIILKQKELESEETKIKERITQNRSSLKESLINEKYS